jgi:hypothetical protein
LGDFLEFLNASRKSLEKFPHGDASVVGIQSIFVMIDGQVPVDLRINDHALVALTDDNPVVRIVIKHWTDLLRHRRDWGVAVGVALHE